MDLNELKMLLMFQNYQLEESPPAIKRVKGKYLGGPKTKNTSNTKQKETKDSPNTITEDPNVPWKTIDLGNGDSLRITVKSVRYASSESLIDNSNQAPSPYSSLNTSSLSMTNEMSQKDSLKSFPEVKPPYQRRTYASCRKKLDSKTRTLLDVLYDRTRRTEQVFDVFVGTDQQSGCKKVEKKVVANKLEEEAAAEEEIEETVVDDDRKQVDEIPSKDEFINEKTFTPPDVIEEEDLDNISINEKELMPFLTKTYANILKNKRKLQKAMKDTEDIYDEISEESDLEPEEVVKTDTDEPPYEKAKRLVEKLTGNIPESEYDECEEEEEEISVFHYRQQPYVNTEVARRPSEPYVTDKDLIIQKSEEAIEAAAIAAKAAESLCRAQPYFREISPLRKHLKSDQ